MLSGFQKSNFTSNCSSLNGAFGADMRNMSARQQPTKHFTPKSRCSSKISFARSRDIADSDEVFVELCSNTFSSACKVYDELAIDAPKYL
jgi:hypothetical protein